LENIITVYGPDHNAMLNNGMARSSNNLQKLTTMVKITCIDNGNTVDALLLYHYPDSITVELNNGLELRLTKHEKHAKLFIGRVGGLEFQCKMP
jgi:hypothetical protein